MTSQIIACLYSMQLWRHCWFCDNTVTTLCGYFHQFRMWPRKREHAPAGDQTKTPTAPENQQKVYGPCDNAAHSWPVWSTTVTTLSRSLGDASSRIHRLHNTATLEPKWTEAPYSPPNIERHGVYTFNGESNGQSYRQQPQQLDATLPVIHRYRADVSLGRFAKADWLKATSCSTLIHLPPRGVPICSLLKT